MTTELQNTCHCGLSMYRAQLYARGQYHRHDRVLLSLGATRRPVRVEIRCVRCEHTFGTSTDRALREKACARDWVSRDDLRTVSA